MDIHIQPNHHKVEIGVHVNSRNEDLVQLRFKEDSTQASVTLRRADWQQVVDALWDVGAFDTEDTEDAAPRLAAVRP